MNVEQAAMLRITTRARFVCSNDLDVGGHRVLRVRHPASTTTPPRRSASSSVITRYYTAETIGTEISHFRCPCKGRAMHNGLPEPNIVKAVHATLRDECDRSDLPRAAFAAAVFFSLLDCAD